MDVGTRQHMAMKSVHPLDRSWYWMIATVMAKTDNAVLLSSDTAEEWVPHKLIKATTDTLAIENTLRVALPTWLAQEKGFISNDF